MLRFIKICKDIFWGIGFGEFTREEKRNIITGVSIIVFGCLFSPISVTFSPINLKIYFVFGGIITIIIGYIIWLSTEHRIVKRDRYESIYNKL